MWKKRIVGITLLMALLPGTGCSTEQEGVSTWWIISGGEAKAVIVLGDTPKQTERYAAKELATYVERISGAKLPIVLESKASKEKNNLICLGVGNIYSRPSWCKSYN